MKTKTVITLILCVISISNRSHANYKHDIIGSNDTTRIIEQIRDQYKIVIANQMNYRLLERDLMGETTEGGFIAAYIDQQDLRKLFVTYYKETGKTIIEYYFNHNSLFFAFVKQYNYDKPIDQTGSKITSTKEDRYYFYNKKLIKWLQGNRLKVASSVNYNAETSNLLSEATRLFKYMSNCNIIPKSTFIKDTMQCKYGSDCPSTGFILKGSRNACGEAIHVNPKNRRLPFEK